ncbi:MAG TPA: hypothetical protein VHZ02_08095 [Acidimicrobiales bacterium]|nr:hypothetical protein [Acidimicrobiales bacterium]
MTGRSLSPGHEPARWKQGWQNGPGSCSWPPRARPIDRLVVEQAQLHAIPAEPYSVALGETRSVSWSSLISFQGSRYSVPYQLCEEVVFVRAKATPS